MGKDFLNRRPVAQEIFPTIHKCNCLKFKYSEVNLCRVNQLT